MRKTICLFGALLVLQLCFGQNREEYVEVIVEDSMSIEPEEFIYAVNIRYFEEKTLHKIKPIHSLVLDKVHTIIKDLKIDTIPSDPYLIINTGVPDYSPFINAIHLRFTSRERLNDFILRIKGLKDISGYITRVTSSRSEEASEQLLKRMIEKARLKSNSLAIAANKVLGPIIMMKEMSLQPEKEEGWTAYPPFAFPYPDELPGERNDKVQIHKKMIIRFNWK